MPKADFGKFQRGEISADEYVSAQKKAMAFLDKCERVPIKLLFAGESFNDPDSEAFLARLLELRTVGYNFPDYVLKEVEEAIKEERQ